MAAPEFVPLDRPRSYTSPPRRDGWDGGRRGELTGVGQPEGDRFGWQGPDQGYALRLAHQMADRLRLQPGEHLDDVIAGCVGVAMRRASIVNRAPVIHDVTIAFRIWGYLDEQPPPELVELRRELFAGLSHHQHYVERRHVVDLVTEDALRSTPAQVEEQHAADWRQLLRL